MKTKFHEQFVVADKLDFKLFQHCINNYLMYFWFSSKSVKSTIKTLKRFKKQLVKVHGNSIILKFKFL